MQFWQRKCRVFRHLCLAVSFLGSMVVFSKPVPDCGRKPASFVPDDDMIIVPVIVENNIYDRFNERHKDEFRGAKQTLRRWVTQQEFAENYDLENRTVFLPTPDQRERFFQRRFMRFLSKDVERGANQNVQQTLEEFTADDEIDQIRAIELHEKVLVKAENDSGQAGLKQSKEIKVQGEKIKFGFQPRVEIGMAKFTLRSRAFRARAWVGVNGNQEVYVERNFESTDTRAFVNYYVDQTRTLASVDQRLTEHWTLRLTHDKDFDKAGDWDKAGITENNILQVRFNMGF